MEQVMLTGKDHEQIGPPVAELDLDVTGHRIKGFVEVPAVAGCAEPLHGAAFPSRAGSGESVAEGKSRSPSGSHCNMRLRGVRIVAGNRALGSPEPVRWRLGAWRRVA